MILTTIGFCCGINVFEEILHAASTFFLHPLRDMPVDVKRKGCSRMANMLLNSFDIIAILK